MVSRSRQVWLILVVALLALIAAFFFGLVASALADDTSVGSIGGIVYPLASTEVAIAALGGAILLTVRLRRVTRQPGCQQAPPQTRGDCRWAARTPAPWRSAPYARLGRSPGR